MNRDPLELPFDQYQRYRVVADLLAGLREKGKPLTILDVGGRTANLRAFLPEDRVFLVDVETSSEPGLVLGDGARLPYQSGAFDVVAAFDTLEHVPPSHRDAFVAECARVARKWIVLAGPYQSPAVDESERILQRFLRDKLGVEHRYLDEHRHNGLPDLAGSRAALEKAGARTAAIGHGNLERWLPLMCMSLWLDHQPELRDLAKAVFRFYNRELYASDHALPVYRHALVGAKAGAPLPTAIAGLAAPQAPAGVLSRFDEVLAEMVGFDRARDAWNDERERLWSITRTLESDLDGHRRTLAEVREARTQSTAKAASLEQDLAGHRASLATLEKELAVARAALAAMEAAREDDRKTRTRLENDVDRTALALASAQADLDGHRHSLATVLDDLAGHKQALAGERARSRGLEATLAALRSETQRLVDQGAVDRETIARREAELLDARTAIAALTADLNGHRGALRDVTTDLEGHRAALRDTGAALRDTRAEFAAALHERNVEQQRLEAAHGELARLNRTLQEKERVLQEKERALGVLRSELRHRVRNLRRAFGPKGPPPA